MKRAQIYLTADQHEFLENLAFVMSRKQHKRVTMSEIIRRAIDLLQEEYPAVENETDRLLRSPRLMESLARAREEEALLDFEDVFGRE